MRNIVFLTLALSVSLSAAAKAQLPVKNVLTLQAAKKIAAAAEVEAHELDNLYVVDASFFCSSGAVNPALTIIANALRVGDHLLERMGTRRAEPEMMATA